MACRGQLLLHKWLRLAPLVIRCHFNDNHEMSKWVWFSLFVVTVVAIGWYGTRPPKPTPPPVAKPVPPVGAASPTGQAPQVPVDTAMPAVSPIPMTPALIEPPKPSPYIYDPPRVDHGIQPEFEPPPGYEAPQVYPEGPMPPPSQVYPLDSSQLPFEESVLGENGEPLPEYMRPPPGAFDPDQMDMAPPPDEQ